MKRFDAFGINDNSALINGAITVACWQLREDDSLCFEDFEARVKELLPPNMPVELYRDKLEENWTLHMSRRSR